MIKKEKKKSFILKEKKKNETKAGNRVEPRGSISLS